MGVVVTRRRVIAGIFIVSLCGLLYATAWRHGHFAFLNRSFPPPVANCTHSSPERCLAVESLNSDDDSDIINPDRYGYLSNASDLCQSADKNHTFTLLVLVCSAVGNFEERRTIRSTWGNVTGGVVRVGFLLAASANQSVMRLVGKESSTHSDVIVGDFVDHYKNLTLKSMMLLKWVKDFCANVQFVMKTDDDMYINIPNLMSSISKLPEKKNVIFGYLFRRTRPIRNPSEKWFVPETQFGGDAFPDYLSGTGYVMSADAVPKLYWASLRTNFIFMEDVFVTGLCAAKVGVKRIQLGGFEYSKRKASGCEFKNAISGHHVSVKDMRTIYEELQRADIVCR